MKLDNEIKIIKKWLDNNADPPFFSDLKLKKLGFTFVGSNVYRYALILNKLSNYIDASKTKKCIDFGSYPGQLQELIFDTFKVKFNLSGLHFSNTFKEYFATYEILDFDFEKTLVDNSFKKKKEAYDLSTAFNIIEHMEYPNKLLDNINYFTKKEGILMLTTDNISTIKNILRMVIGGKSPNESLIKSKIFYNGEWRPHVRIFSKDELFFLLNYSGFKVIEHSYFNLRARQYKLNSNALVRKRRSFKGSVLEFMEYLFPFYKDHHFIVAKKVVNFDDLNNMRMLPTSSTDEWISYRYNHYEIFNKTK
jgi:2-polyprenyl-3-methyl-5-hydroxy-6-metoxy-1,4-benzoquinol methylase